jgi:hypothetical protein
MLSLQHGASAVDDKSEREMICIIAGAIYTVIEPDLGLIDCERLAADLLINLRANTNQPEDTIITKALPGIPWYVRERIKELVHEFDLS